MTQVVLRRLGLDTNCKLLFCCSVGLYDIELTNINCTKFSNIL